MPLVQSSVRNLAVLSRAAVLWRRTMCGRRWPPIRPATALLVAVWLSACGASEPARRLNGVRPLSGFTTETEWNREALLAPLRAHATRVGELEEPIAGEGEDCFPDSERVPTNLRCRIADGSIYFEQPYLGWTRNIVYTEDGPHHIETGWARPAQVMDGDAIAIAMRERARHADFSCAGTGTAKCTVFMRSYYGQAEILQECLVLRIDGVPGAPEDCRPRAVTVERSTYLPVMLKVTPGLPPSEGRVEPPHIDVIREPVPHRAALVLLAQGALEGEPFDLTIHRERRRGRESLVGVANRRRSTILSGWYETMTLRVNVSHRTRERDGEQVRLATVHVDPTIYVSRVATPEPRDWRVPTASQMDRYHDAIIRSLEARLPRLCPRHSWPDDTTLVCE